MHNNKDDVNWEKSTQDVIRDYIPLTVMILMVVVGVVLAIFDK